MRLRPAAGVEENIGPACEWHHPDKNRGWEVSQPQPGRFVWRSPLGQVYRTRGEPIRYDLPAPQPPTTGTDTRADPDGLDRVDLQILWRPATPQRPPPGPTQREPEGEPPF